MAPAVLHTTWFGAFLLEDGEVREERPFPQDASAIADRLATVRDGDILDEERDLAKAADTVLVPHRRLLSLPNASMGEGAAVHLPGDAHGFAAELLKAAAVELAERTIREGLSNRTLHLMQAVSALDEAHDLENLVGERLVAWFTLHAPEAVRAAKDHNELAAQVLEMPDEGITSELGSAFTPQELAAVRGLARSLVAQVEARRPLESYIEKTTEDLAPNLTKLVGPKIAARLVHQAGGLEDLAKMPASTLQTLGAEKALFRHLVQGAPPPKHGVIFQHPLIHRAHPNDRGPIARALAAKAIIAARADAFTGNDIAAELKAAVEARAEEVRRVGRRRAAAKRQGGRRGGGRRG